MTIIERGQAFLQRLQALVGKTAWDWRRCPWCGDRWTCKWGHYTRQPWTLAGRQVVRVPRHWCHACQKTYSEESPWLVRGGWYAREVRRFVLDHRVHVGSSVRRTAEWTRSLLGHQERWRVWRPLDPLPDDRAACHLSVGTLVRWEDEAGVAARRTVVDQLQGVPTSGQLATDGLWARFRGSTGKGRTGKGRTGNGRTGNGRTGNGRTGVLLALVDRVTGVLWPPVVVDGEAAPGPWARLFRRARVAGLDVHQVRGITSDGAPGLEAYRRVTLPWVSHQRCVFHLWRGLASDLAHAVATATAGLTGATAKAVRTQTRRTLVGLIRAVYDATSWAAAEAALARLAAHDLGADLARTINKDLDAALVYLCGYNHGLGRASPEWLWRHFRLRLSRGRNHGQDHHLERAALIWAVYHNFEPAQERSERTRHYRHPGRCPLALAGVPPGPVTYLDALGI